MWFISLAKLNQIPDKQFQDWINAKRAEGEKWGIKFHDTFLTLGKYDAVVVYEAPDEKVAMRYAQSLAPQIKSQTLVALSRDEVFGWYK